MCLGWFWWCDMFSCRTMSGRRLRDAVKTSLVSNGFTSDAVVVIAGLSNTYSDYVATYEEYQVSPSPPSLASPQNCIHFCVVIGSALWRSLHSVWATHSGRLRSGVLTSCRCSCQGKYNHATSHYECLLWLYQIQGTSLEPGPDFPNYYDKQWAFHMPVVFDAAPSEFGDIKTDVNSTYRVVSNRAQGPGYF